MVLAAGLAPARATLSTSCLFCWTTRAKKNVSLAVALLLGKSDLADRLLPMPQTEPIEPPTKPETEPVPREPSAPPSQPKREPDPFNPDWPETRPTPPPKA